MTILPLPVLLPQFPEKAAQDGRAFFL